MSSATMAIRLDGTEKKLVTDHAKTFGTSVFEFARRAALDQIENEIDLKAWEAAKREFDKDPVTTLE